jgi:hypothetical protein
VAAGFGFIAARPAVDEAVDGGGDEASDDTGAIVGVGVSTFAASVRGALSGDDRREKRIAPAAVPASSNPTAPTANGHLRPD